MFAFILFFTVLFNGGLTASYILDQVFHVKNTIWALILPGSLMGAMNVLMVRNYFNANSLFHH